MEVEDLANKLIMELASESIEATLGPAVQYGIKVRLASGLGCLVVYCGKKKPSLTKNELIRPEQVLCEKIDCAWERAKKIAIGQIRVIAGNQPTGKHYLADYAADLYQWAEGLLPWRDQIEWTHIIDQIRHVCIQFNPNEVPTGKDAFISPEEWVELLRHTYNINISRAGSTGDYHGSK